jgi:hypothetical protein
LINKSKAIARFRRQAIASYNQISKGGKKMINYIVREVGQKRTLTSTQQQLNCSLLIARSEFVEGGVA